VVLLEQATRAVKHISRCRTQCHDLRLATRLVRQCWRQNTVKAEVSRSVQQERKESGTLKNSGKRCTNWARWSRSAHFKFGCNAISLCKIDPPVANAMCCKMSISYGGRTPKLRQGHWRICFGSRSASKEKWMDLDSSSEEEVGWLL